MLADRPDGEPPEAGPAAPGKGPGTRSTAPGERPGTRSTAPGEGPGTPRAAPTGWPDGPDDLLARLRRAERDRRSLLRQLLTAQEDERRRLAGDLHDDAIQSLAAALLHLDVLEARLKGVGAAASPGVGEGVGRLRQNLEHALRAARAFLFGLRPHRLDADGLRAALELQLERLRA